MITVIVMAIGVVLLSIGVALLSGIGHDAVRLLTLRGLGPARLRDRPAARAAGETTAAAEAEERALARRLLAGRLAPVSYRNRMDTLAHRTPQPHGGPHG
ncbi:hypothetical protein [Streptomyces sp. WAC00263]|uniref:hypothetical protein n=1 Tax=Streptomyces sp. WAC00263 TaxID=1917422 RepID=UPI0009C93FE8|nr:hypothetical protein [Streptomyces sp. WAC00263]